MFLSTSSAKRFIHSELLVTTKGGLTRTGPGQWHPVGRPEYLRQQALMSLRFLGLEQIGLWQLHRIDPKVASNEQFGAIKAMLDDGLIRYAGLSEVSVEEIKAAEGFSGIDRAEPIQSH